MPTDPILELLAFIDERWAVAQPRFYPTAVERPRVHPEVTIEEAQCFMASVTAKGTEAPLIQVDDERKMRSDRFPPRRDGSPRAMRATRARSSSCSGSIMAKRSRWAN